MADAHDDASPTWPPPSTPSKRIPTATSCPRTGREPNAWTPLVSSPSTPASPTPSARAARSCLQWEPLWITPSRGERTPKVAAARPYPCDSRCPVSL